MTSVENTAVPSVSDVLDDLTTRAVPGLAAIVSRQDAGCRECARGIADMVARRPMGPDTVCLWFSMTKIVTATVAMQLAERGDLDLDDPVRGYLPEFPEPRAGWPAVTVRHLLSHSSGLGNPIPVRWVHPAGEAPREPHGFTLGLLERHGRLRFPAGSRAAYTNLGYLALGEVISAAGGQRYEDQVRRNILVPLGMDRTDFVYRPDMVGDAATGYQLRRSPMTPVFRLMVPRGICGDSQGRFLAFRRFCVDGPAYGGLIGSVRDAARFMAVHLNGGAVGGVRILTPDSVAAMQTIQAAGPKMEVGLGWFRRRSDRPSTERHLEHLGGGGGFFNMMRIHPDRGAGVVVMGNATAYDHQRIAASALR